MSINKTLYQLDLQIYKSNSPDTSVVHAFGTVQLHANPPVVGPRLSPGKTTRRAVTAMASNHLVVDEDHVFAPAAHIVEGNPIHIKPVWCSRAGESRQTGSLCHSIS